MDQFKESLDDASGARIARVILQHAAKISKEQDISALVGMQAALARDLVGGDRASVWLIDEEKGELWTRVADGVDEIRIPLNTGIVGACIAENRTILANDLRNDTRFHRQVDQKSGYQTESVLCTPLHADNTTIGALQLLNKPGGFLAGDAELTGLMAVYAASAIQAERLRTEAEMGRLLSHELNIAREVQMKLLPRSFPSLPGLEYTGFCRSARFVGGDYFDLLPLENGSFAFTLGDVSGKGVPAAVLMASIHTLLRSLLSENWRNLGETVGRLNEAMHLTSSGDRYSTLFCGIVNPDRSEMRCVNAGHIPPLIIRSNGEVDRPVGADFPVGMLRGTTYQERTVPLTPGSVVVCVSDGLTEVKNDKFEFWDEQIIEDVARKHRDGSLDLMTNAFIEAADAWAAGSEQHDDMTAVAVRISAN
jgi:sigma-B regulation protein RsbU (phosphoserine phosphatase)